MDVAAGQRLDDAEDEPADDRAGQARQPAEHGGREALEKNAEADVRIEQRQRRHQHGRGGGDRGADGERER